MIRDACAASAALAGKPRASGDDPYGDAGPGDDLA